MNIFSIYFKSSLLKRMMIALMLGAIIGLIVGPGIEWISPLGNIFMRLLKMIVMPVVVFTMIAGASNMHPASLGRVGGKALLLYIFTTAFAVALGLLFGNLFQPGKSLTLETEQKFLDRDISVPSIMDILVNVIPTNPFDAIVSGKILPTIFFCVLFGVGIACLRESDDKYVQDAAGTLLSFFAGGAEIMYKIVGWILQYSPIGVFALIAVVFGKQGIQAFSQLCTITLTFYTAIFVHIFLVYMCMLKLFKFYPVIFFQKAREAMITAFVSRSSSGTLPITMDVAEKKMGISKGVYSFSLSLGATVNMNGTAIYLGVCSVFVSLAVGATLTFNQYATVIMTSVLASIGTAGVPGSGAIMMMMVLNSIGLSALPGTPVAMAYAMIFGIDAVLDMGRTCCNVTGDLVVTCIVAKTENELCEDHWKCTQKVADGLNI